MSLHNRNQRKWGLSSCYPHPRYLHRIPVGYEIFKCIVRIALASRRRHYDCSAAKEKERAIRRAQRLGNRTQQEYVPVSPFHSGAYRALRSLCCLRSKDLGTYICLAVPPATNAGVFGLPIIVCGREFPDQWEQGTAVPSPG